MSVCMSAAATVPPGEGHSVIQPTCCFHEMSENKISPTAAPSRMGDRGLGAPRSTESSSSKGARGERTAGSPSYLATAKELGKECAAGPSLGNTATASVLVDPGRFEPGPDPEDLPAFRFEGSNTDDSEAVAGRTRAGGGVDYSRLLAEGERFASVSRPDAAIRRDSPPLGAIKKKRGRIQETLSPPEKFEVPLLAKETNTRKKRCPLPPLGLSGTEASSFAETDDLIEMSDDDIDDWKGLARLKGSGETPYRAKRPTKPARTKRPSEGVVFSTSPRACEEGEDSSVGSRLPGMSSQEICSRVLGWLEDAEKIRRGTVGIQGCWSGKLHSRNGSIGAAVKVLFSRATRKNGDAHLGAENEKLKRQIKESEERIIGLQEQVTVGNGRITDLEDELRSLKREVALGRSYSVAGGTGAPLPGAGGRRFWPRPPPRWRRLPSRLSCWSTRIWTGGWP